MKSDERTHSGADRISRLLLRCVDVFIAALVFVLPFVMGGRQAWGHWFLITFALLLGVSWAVYAAFTGTRYRISWIEVFLLAGLGIAWFQVQPQSAETMNQISPEYARLLPSWAATQSGSDVTAWSTFSFTPVETRHAWWVFLAYALIVTVVFQRIRQPADGDRLLKWVGIVGISMTSFALFQWATSNGRFFWFYEHPFTDTTVHLKGAFTNRNHFAQFLSLTIGPLLWWLFRDVKLFLNSDRATTSATAAPRTKSKKRSGTSGLFQKSNLQVPPGLPILVLLLGVVLVITGALLSFSRGGMIACGAATLIALAGLWRGFKLGGAMAGILLGGGLALLSLLAFSDQEQLQTKLDQLISADAEQIDTGGNRQAIWAADAKVIQRFPLLGTGVGSHGDVYTLYMDNYADFAMAEMTHAESSFVHTALETGLVGAGILVAALLFLLAKLVVGVFRTSLDTNRACAIAVIASATGAILHAVVDFIWYVPGIVVVSLVLVAVGLSAASRKFGTPEASPGIWFPRAGWAAVAGMCLLGLVRVQPDLIARIHGEQHWFAALRTELDIPNNDSDRFQNLVAGDALDVEDDTPRPTPEDEARAATVAVARSEVAQLKYLSERIEHLNKSLAARPDQHRVRLALADNLMKLFDLLQMKGDSPFPLKMLRDTARTAGFSSAEEMRLWLKGNCGKRLDLVVLADRLARESLAACPVQGYAYLCLVETSFLNDPLDPLHQKMIDQAMLVRSNDPRVRFVAGHEAIMGQDWETGLKLWDSVFHSNQQFRLNILQMTAAQTQVEFFLEQFKPNAAELQDLLAIYDALDRKRDAEVLLKALCKAIPEEAPTVEDEDERLEALMFVYNCARRLENLPLAARFLATTTEEFPLAIEPHYQLGMTLVELDRPDAAMEHLQWCYDQDPSHAWVPGLILRARKQMLKSEHLTQR